MSLIVPHWIPSNLWWALPLLAAVLGAALRRVLPRTAAVRGAPVCLLAGLAGTLIWRGALVAGLASRGRIWSTGLPLLALAVLAAGGAGPARYGDLHKRRPAAGHRSVPAAAGRHPPLHQSGQKQPAFPHPVSRRSPPRSLAQCSSAKGAPSHPSRFRRSGGAAMSSISISASAGPPPPNTKAGRVFSTAGLLRRGQPRRRGSELIPCSVEVGAALPEFRSARAGAAFCPPLHPSVREALSTALLILPTAM